MRIILLLSLLVCSTAFGDELILKDGKKVEWRTLTDSGDTFEVETPQGAKVTVKKSDVEKIAFNGSGLLTGAVFTKLAGKVKTHNCFTLFDPKKDLFGGIGIEAKFKGPGLIMNLGFDSPNRLQIPFKIGEEYDFILNVERKDGPCDFFVGLVGGGKPFVVRFDENGIKTGILGWKMTDMGGLILKKDAPVTLSCFVRKDSVIVMADKKEIVNWKGDTWDFKLPDGYALPENKVFLFVGSQKIVGVSANQWAINKMSLTIKE
jgi:hypothetical protein